MTKNLSLALTLITAFSGFAVEMTVPTVQEFTTTPQKIVLHEPKSLQPDSFQAVDTSPRVLNKKGSIYLRAMTDAEPAQGREIFPGLGIGYRTSFNNSGVDISVNYSSGEGVKGHSLWTAPKVSYLYYVSPTADQSLYAGAGLAWGGTRTESNRGIQETHFRGLVPHITVGYEFLRNSLIFSFTEFILSQPLFPSTLQGAKPGPVGELSLGAGF